MPVTRKRAATLDVDNTNRTHIQDLSLDCAETNESSSKDGTREHACLCQPDPKIPRPRNAFILYRQHMQAQVVTQHPGLANPEISKIIGEQWKSQPPEVKNSWKQLAEEEKQRHQRQYPEYRYQPRRGGKTPGLTNATIIPEDGTTHCPKCGGRYISTPSTPLTPFTPGIGLHHLQYELVPSISQPSLKSSEINQSFQNNRAAQSRLPRATVATQHPQYSQRGYSSQFLSTHYENGKEMEAPIELHGQKRRRLNDQTDQPEHSSSHYSSQAPGPHEFAPFRDDYSIVGGVYKASPLTMTGQSHPGVGTVQVSTPVRQTPSHPYITRSSVSSTNFDESLRLPPIQTQISTTSARFQQTPQSKLQEGSAETRDFQAQDLESMIMSISYLNKINVLSSISPPLRSPMASHLSFETRGFVIAVEGHDQGLLETVGQLVEEKLHADNELSLRSWATVPHDSSNESTAMSKLIQDRKAGDISTQLRSTSTRQSAISRRNENSVDTSTSDHFVEYLSTINGMHQTSMEIVKHITTVPPSSSPIFTSQVQTRNQNLLQNQHKKQRIPVALLPTGFSLTTSDMYACRIPITDSYTPIDHWQWMATLWRGIVGPDLTVYCLRVGQDEIARFGSVEVKDEGVVIVRALGDVADRTDRMINEDVGKKRNGVDEKTVRRLGFEVLEFIKSRDVGFGRG